MRPPLCVQSSFLDQAGLRMRPSDKKKREADYYNPVSSTCTSLWMETVEWQQFQRLMFVILKRYTDCSSANVMELM